MARSIAIRTVSLLVAAAIFAASLPVLPASAAMVSTDQAIESATPPAVAGAEMRALLEAALARQSVRGELRAMGVDADEAALRIAALSDRELAELADRIGGLPAGGQEDSTLVKILGYTLAAVLAILMIGAAIWAINVGKSLDSI